VSVVSTISAERERYVAYFEAVAADVASKGSAHARELLIAINNDALAYPYRYLRADLIEKAADGSDRLYDVWLDPQKDAEAMGFQLGPVRIEIYPFTWCSIQIAFDRPLPDLAKFEALLTAWLDIDDARTSPTGVANAIHSVSPLESDGQLWFLTIDFGSAATDTMLDLIDFLANEGMVERIIIASHPRE
jgi:hypothetical protein